MHLQSRINLSHGLLLISLQSGQVLVPSPSQELISSSGHSAPQTSHVTSIEPESSAPQYVQRYPEVESLF